MLWEKLARNQAFRLLPTRLAFRIPSFNKRFKSKTSVSPIAFRQSFHSRFSPVKLSPKELPMSYCSAITSMAEDKKAIHQPYHDFHYGFPIQEDDELFCRLVLEIN